ncbi:MAG: alpha/beta family hydrolase [Casimicrobium sp.]
MYLRVALFSLVTMCSLHSLATEVVLIDAPRASKLELLIDLPPSDKPLPTILIAPGQGYHARLPLFERLVEAAKSNGIGVVRFNWTYFTADPKNGKPSEKLAREIEDMEVALSWTKSSAKIDSQRIVIAGKSLGSLVAWQVFKRDTKANALLLLTPVCIDMSQEKTRDATFENYIGFEGINRASLLLVGDNDPLCPTQYLYSAASRAKTSPRVVIVGGDHGFSDKTANDPDKTRAANLDLAVRSSIDFALKQLSMR